MVTVGTGIFEVVVLLILNDRRGFAEAFDFFLAILSYIKHEGLSKQVP